MTQPSDFFHVCTLFCALFSLIQLFSENAQMLLNARPWPQVLVLPHPSIPRTCDKTDRRLHWWRWRNSFFFYGYIQTYSHVLNSARWPHSRCCQSTRLRRCSRSLEFFAPNHHLFILLPTCSCLLFESVSNFAPVWSFIQKSAPEVLIELGPDNPMTSFCVSSTFNRFLSSSCLFNYSLRKYGKNRLITKTSNAFRSVHYRGCVSTVKRCHFRSCFVLLFIVNSFDGFLYQNLKFKF